MKQWARMLVLLAVSSVPVIASAQSYPTRPVRFIIPFAPGGGADLVGRLLGQKLTEVWAQPVIIDNRPGAGATIAAEISARAAPDGYTLFQFNIANAIAASVRRKVSYDPVKDFAAVTQLASTPFILVGHPGLKAQNVQELIALAKSAPGTLNYSSSGTGGPSHLLGELFNAMAKTKIVHVPYASVAPALNDLLPGRVQLMFVIPAVAMPHIKAGRLRTFGISSSKRSPLAPDIPTLAESGLTGFEGGAWYGVVVPAATSKAIVSKVATDIIGIMRQPEVTQSLLKQGVEVIASTPDEFARFIKSEIAKFARIVAESGARLD
jgi:tripartite-type tricarboxylate transporter receptor subunit TctC